MKLSSRVCKQLRGLAQARSVGLPERQLLGVRRVITINGSQYDQWQAVNASKSTRGIYRALKREARRA
jgi:hypothetical protein